MNVIWDLEDEEEMEERERKRALYMIWNAHKITHQALRLRVLKGGEEISFSLRNC